MNKKILVISPHPDDDVIGMGGTIAVELKKQACIDIVYVSNGVGSIKTATYQHLTDKEFVELRKQEAIQSIQVIGGCSKNINSFFWELTSETIKKEPNILQALLIDFLDKKNYTQIYLPHLNDRHPTHQAVSICVMDIVKNLNIKASLFGYEIWNPILFDQNIVGVDISQYANIKQSAIKEHKSQCDIKNFDEGILAKNKYNAIFYDINFSNNVLFLELFQVLSQK